MSSDLSIDQHQLTRDQLTAEQETSRLLSNSNAALREQMDGLLSQLQALRATPQERIATALERIATVMEREAAFKEHERREAVPAIPRVSHEDWLNGFSQRAFSDNSSL